MLSKPRDPRPMPVGEEDDSYLKPGMKDENESTHNVGRPKPVPMPKVGGKNNPKKYAVPMPKVGGSKASKVAAMKKFIKK